MRKLFSAVGPVVVAVLLAAGSAPGKSKPSPAGRITYLKGWAQVLRGNQATPLKRGTQLFWGDQVVTGKKRTRVEIKLNDGSVLRLGRNSKLAIEKAAFTAKDRQFSAKLMRGKAYAMVARVTTANSSFRITTKNAVAGVRGTTFRIDAKRDRSTVVRVYTGAVAVSNAPLFTKPGRPPRGQKVPTVPRRGVKPGGPGRVEVAGPQEITKQQWEEMVAKAMQEIRVAADGKLSAPVAFDAAADAADEWVAWNKSRDQQLEESTPE